MTEILTPASEAELAEAVAAAASARTPLEIRGGGTRATLGRPVQTERWVEVESRFIGSLLRKSGPASGAAAAPCG